MHGIYLWFIYYFIVPCPRMILSPRPISVHPNTTVTFSCLAWSFGGLTYKWTRSDNSTLPLGSNVFFKDNRIPADTSYLTTLYKLQILNVQIMDEGLYCCEASNECGSNKRCAWLEVDSKLDWSVRGWHMYVCYLCRYLICFIYNTETAQNHICFFSSVWIPT